MLRECDVLGLFWCLSNVYFVFNPLFYEINQETEKQYGKQIVQSAKNTVTLGTYRYGGRDLQKQ